MSSPLIELLNIAPKDLWPNADMFYKQVTAERLKKEKPGSAQTHSKATASVNADAGSAAAGHDEVALKAKKVAYHKAHGKTHKGGEKAEHPNLH